MPASACKNLGLATFQKHFHDRSFRRTEVHSRSQEGALAADRLPVAPTIRDNGDCMSASFSSSGTISRRRGTYGNMVSPSISLALFSTTRYYLRWRTLHIANPKNGGSRSDVLALARCFPSLIYGPKSTPQPRRSVLSPRGEQPTLKCVNMKQGDEGATNAER